MVHREASDYLKLSTHALKGVFFSWLKEEDQRNTIQKHILQRNTPVSLMEVNTDALKSNQF